MVRSTKNMVCLGLVCEATRLSSLFDRFLLISTNVNQSEKLRFTNVQAQTRIIYRRITSLNSMANANTYISIQQKLALPIMAIMARHKLVIFDNRNLKLEH